MHSDFSEHPKVLVFPDRNLMGLAAAALVHREIRRLVMAKGGARIVMACAPSQDDYYAALIPLVNAEPEIWKKVTVFHMDEYVGLCDGGPQSFRSYLRSRFLNHVEVRTFHPIRGDAEDSDSEARRYQVLLDAGPIDVISLGIGENGHIAFNDPPVADFGDDRRVKKVELDPICRQQQVNDGCFPLLDEVPTHALTLTLPVFASAGLLACIVPSSRKAEAVRKTVAGAIGTDCPATLLRQHANSHLFIDRDAASLIEDGHFAKR